MCLYDVYTCVLHVIRTISHMRTFDSWTTVKMEPCCLGCGLTTTILVSPTMLEGPMLSHAVNHSLTVIVSNLMVGCCCFPSTRYSQSNIWILILNIQYDWSTLSLYTEPCLMKALLVLMPQCFTCSSLRYVYIRFLWISQSNQRSHCGNTIAWQCAIIDLYYCAHSPASLKC